MLKRWIQREYDKKTNHSTISENQYTYGLHAITNMHDKIICTQWISEVFQQEIRQ